jgi:hypothetical protein
MIQIYKPQKNNAGCAVSFRMGVSGKSKEPRVYVNAIMQYSWNEQTRNGSFSENAKNPEKTVIIKLNEFELGGLINAIENYTEYKGFHSFGDNKTAISFKPYNKQDGSKAFSFSITKNSALKFGVGLEAGEAYALREFLKDALLQIFRFRQSIQNSFHND